MPPITPDIQRWLEHLVRERISPALELRLNDGAWELRVPGSNQRTTIACDADAYQKLVRSLPPTVAAWDPRAAGFESPLGLPLLLPGVATAPSPIVVETANGIHLHYDVLWLVLWLLSRAEEAASSERDIYDRFPAAASHAVRLGYLSRPVVDEWFLLLRQVVRRTWPGLAIVRDEFQTLVSHDVDEPRLIEDLSWPAALRHAAGDVFKRRRIARGCETPLRWLLLRGGGAGVDPFDTFSWLMHQSTRRGLRATFHFLCGRTDPRYDRTYDIGSPRFQKLLREIHARGHRIGLHPSYGAHVDARALQAECDRLQATCAGLDIALERVSSRMHYLRWTTPDTPRALADAGVAQDVSLGYPEQIGFRCGTGHEYTAFDPVRREVINLRIQPLLAMDITLLPGPYMNLSFSDADRRLADLKQTCRRVGGGFTLCWHNSELDSRPKRRLFESVLDS